MRHHGLPIVVTGPPGSGKHTLATHIARSIKSCEFSVSATTRPHRGGETKGHDYFFISDEDFDRNLKEGRFLEHTTHNGNRYATRREPVEHILGVGKHMVFAVNVEGALNIKKAYPNTISIFLLPPEPHIDVLEHRLVAEGTKNQRLIVPLLDQAEREIKMRNKFDLILVNDERTAAETAIIAMVKGILHQVDA